ncbi:MAG TPA: DNA-processing protein DprA, partial [Oscillospiraceae bacterium]|nr:DNA-processing protein DprA [Oscillospiraceae bacterium]
MSALKYWLWLMTRPGMKNAVARRAVEQFASPEGAFFADAEDYRAAGGFSEREIAALADKSESGAEEILARCHALGVWVLTMQDADYPDRLKNIYDPPVLLYGMGRRILFDEEVAVAVVGTRSCSPYGASAAQRLGFQLGRGGAVVVSGLARGVDSEAVRGALRAGAVPVGVLGGGIDVVYPPENRTLFQDVAAGCLLSEYPPGAEPKGKHFPIRNRIISGLSLGVVVVEGGLESGALITANHAADQGRDVFAVPGNIDAPGSAGPNRLLRQGAIPATCGEDILGEYLALYPHKIRHAGGWEPPAQLARSAPAQAPAEESVPEKELDSPDGRAYIDLQARGDTLSEDEKTILRAVGAATLQIDEIIENAQLPAARGLSV